MNLGTSMRDRILAAALECMREHGVGATTTKNVARRAGVSEGSIYNHFSNRSELIIEAFGDATSAIRHRAIGLKQLVGTNSVEENVVELMEAIIEFLREIAPIAGSVIGDIELRSWFTDEPAMSSAGQRLTPLNGVVELSDYLEREHEQGRLRERDSWVVCASMLIGACMQYVYLELLSPSGSASIFTMDENSVHEYARTVVRTLFSE
ncbi:TetR/AcrR family transcriptional regulator [Brevibacterium yomogidense]|uniref:TetR/AcrR family transcriptional regulator n=1 Tax=Brevibacterium yomogidense TaxID=946573 RepID=UPI0018DF9A57|nr:TetR/AcrR family transcriptional regulator [Brevibacterium yomogidense]